MKIVFVLALFVCSIISTNSRLLERMNLRSLNNTKTGNNPAVRRPRQLEELDAFAVTSREDNARSDEFISYYSNKVDQYNKLKEIKSDTHVRRPRVSSDNHRKASNNVTLPTSKTLVTQPMSKPTLVKKPIPKYNDMEYDEDFQIKISRSPTAIIDSGEHEDEDFNLNDYDFDTNHDEFISRGKPLVPMLKQKEFRPNVGTIKAVAKPVVIPEVKMRSQVNIPASNRAISNKKQRSVEAPKKSEKEDYYDDTTTTRATEKPAELDDELNEDNEDSKEFFSKTSSIRQARSPWKMNGYEDKFGEKFSPFKMLSSLPMFPQVPGRERDFRYNIERGYLRQK